MDEEKQAKLKQWLKMYLLQSPGLVVTSIICVIVIIILLGLVAYFMRFRGEPSPNGSSTNYQCTSWSNAPAGIQEAITNSANSAGVHPAMLGAIFLAEHGNNWSDTASRISSNSDWINSGWQTDTSGKGARGPFQFLPSTWSSYGKGGNVQNFNDAAAGAARYIADGLKQAGLPVNSSDQKSAYFVGLWYNAGNVATSWAKAGFDTSKPPSGVGWGENGTINGQSLGYAQRVWILLQGLNKGCDVLNIAGGITGKTIMPLKNVAGLNNTRHDCSISSPGRCDVAGHRTFLGTVSPGTTKSVGLAVTVGEAIDLGSPKDTAVYAPFSGSVVATGDAHKGSFIAIKSTDSKSIALLAHINSALQTGATVNIGDQVGTLAITHLHFEIWINGVPVNAGYGATPAQIWDAMKKAMGQ